MIETFDAHSDFKGFSVDTGSLRAELIELGGTVTRLEVPDREGTFADVLLGCPTIADYLGPHPHFNCLVGRYANRMTNAEFTLDGIAHDLDANIPPHHLHGGRDGFGLRRWQGEVDGDGIVFRLRSTSGDGGYPGTLAVKAEYRFAGARVALEITATTDTPTPVSGPRRAVPRDAAVSRCAQPPELPERHPASGRALSRPNGVRILGEVTAERVRDGLVPSRRQGRADNRAPCRAPWGSPYELASAARWRLIFAT